MTAITPTTELEAVNIMLAAIGEAPINSLTQSGLGDAIQAQAKLSQVSRDVQSQGWNFNTDREYPLPIAVDGTIAVPANTLSIEIADSMRETWWVTQRQGKIWDKKNLTFVFSQTLKFNIKWLFTFEDLPEYARSFIALRAARIFIDQTVGNSDMNGFAAADEAMALANLKQNDGEVADYNILVGNYSVFRTLDRLSTSAGTLIQQ